MEAKKHTTTTTTSTTANPYGVIAMKVDAYRYVPGASATSAAHVHFYKFQKVPAGIPTTKRLADYSTNSKSNAMVNNNKNISAVVDVGASGDSIQVWTEQNVTQAQLEGNNGGVDTNTGLVAALVSLRNGYNKNNSGKTVGNILNDVTYVKDAYADTETTITKIPGESPLALDFERKPLSSTFTIENASSHYGFTSFWTGTVGTILQDAVTNNKLIFFFGDQYTSGTATDEGAIGGCHDVHFNQGNVAQFANENRAYGDGAIIVDNNNGTYNLICVKFTTQAFVGPTIASGSGTAPANTPDNTDPSDNTNNQDNINTSDVTNDVNHHKRRRHRKN